MEITSLREIEEEEKYLLSPGHHLNHGSFGAVSQSLFNLDIALRTHIESNPEKYYDYQCLPLVRESHAVCD
jgi:hypothetical protein